MGTEGRNPRSMNLDQLSALEIVALMNQEEVQALEAVKAAAPSIAVCIQHCARAYQAGGRIVTVGAGTSGRLARLDAAEMPPTFGVEAERFVAAVAGGDAAVSKAIEGAEDDVQAGAQAMASIKLQPTDVVIGLAASGTTPFVVSAILAAKGICWTCGVANNPDTPLLREADHAVLLDTGEEVLTGSTRLKAGTAQKLFLNRMSTGTMVLCGAVHENLMINVQATNNKLRKRSIEIVHQILGCPLDEAEALLIGHEWKISSVLSARKGSSEI